MDDMERLRKSLLSTWPGRFWYAYYGIVHYPYRVLLRIKTKRTLRKHPPFVRTYHAVMGWTNARLDWDGHDYDVTYNDWCFHTFDTEAKAVKRGEEFAKEEGIAYGGVRTKG